MKVVVAQFIYESNTFNATEAEIELFVEGGTWRVGVDAVRQWAGLAASQLGGSLAVLEAAGCETFPVMAAVCGTPAGRLTASCFRTLRETMRDSLRKELPADVILLHLHGSACAVGEDDTEGNLLEMVRNELGFAGRVVLSLDLHANVTRRMLQHADAVTAYRTMPHCDFRETGERAARLVLEPARKLFRTLAKMPALLPPTDTHHARGPFAEILQEARNLDGKPGVLDVSMFPVQPWMDVPELGSSVVITSTGRAAVADDARALAEKWFEQRRRWRTGIRSWDEIRGVLRTRAARPWMLVDASDATTSGSPGTSAEAIAQLWAGRDDYAAHVLLNVVDEAACAAGERGGREFVLGVQRFRVSAEVIFKGEGRFFARGGTYTGQEFYMGRVVVLAAGQIRIVVSTRGALAADPAFYESVGLEPNTALAVHVKSPMGWRAGYSASEEQGLIFDGPGVASLNFLRVPFTGVGRNLFPVANPPAAAITVWQTPGPSEPVI